jgi:capsular exopolysaccharide synthesis family protein
MEPENNNQERRFRDFFAIVKRRWAIILATIVVCTGLGAVATYLIEPTYASSVWIELEGRTKDFSNAAGDFGGLGRVSIQNPTDDLPTQVEVLMSQVVFENAAKQAGVQSIRRSPDGGNLDPSIRSKQVGPTNVIQVTAESSQKEVAQAVATQVPAAYRDYVENKLGGQLDGAVNYVRAQLDEDKKALRAAQDELERFRTVHHITNGDQENQSRLQRMAGAEADLRVAEQKLVAAKDYYDSIKRDRDALPQTIKAPSDHVNDQERELVKEKIADLKGQLEAKRKIWADTSQEVRSVQAQLDEEEKYYASMPKKFESSGVIRNPQLEVYEQKVDEGKAQLESARSARDVAATALSIAKRDVEDYVKIEGDYERLALAVTNAKQNADKTTLDLEDLSLRRSKAKSPVSTIQTASLPEIVRPRLEIDLLLGAVIGIFLGIGLAALRERYDDRVYSSEGILEASGLKALGSISLGASRLPALITEDRSLAVNDNYRMLRSTLLHSGAEAFRSIAFCSSLADEGRSESAVNLAASMAMGGHQVVLLDANFRNPALSRLMAVPEAPGLAELLRREVAARDVARMTTVEGLHVISAGHPDGIAAELLGSDTFTGLLEDLKERYHFVVVDTSPCLAGADGPVTAASCEATVFVVKLGTSRRSATRYSVDLLQRTRANVLGVLTNKPGANPRTEFRDFADA